MARELSSYAADCLKRWEGKNGKFSDVVYADPAGVPTGGWGHADHALVVGSPVTAEQADFWFADDTLLARSCVESAVEASLNDNQFGALVSFVFNVGCPAFRKSTLLRKLNAGDYAAVPSELAKWVYITKNGRKVALDGLRNRRSAEIGLWSTGAFVDSADISPEPPVPLWKSPAAKSLAAVAAGTSGTALTTAAQQMHDLAKYGDFFVWAFIGLTSAAVLVSLWQHIRQ